MAHARPEYAVTVALIGVLVAIGIPALHRGRLITGGIFVLLAAGIACWAAVAFWRERH